MPTGNAWKCSGVAISLPLSLLLESEDNRIRFDDSESEESIPDKVDDFRLRGDGDGVTEVEELAMSSRWVMLIPFGTRLGS